MTSKCTTGANWRKVPRHQVEPPLANLIDAAADIFAAANPGLSIVVTEGPRSHERQRELKRLGASGTLHSKHIPDLSPTKRALAVDIAVFQGKDPLWTWPLYEAFAQIVKAEAHRNGVKLTWGGDWPKLRDGPHYQIEI